MYYLAVQLGLAIGIRRLRSEAGTAKPFVSIIVAARNEQRTIGNLLQTLVSQTYQSHEIIIVNDRSTDSTAEIVRAFQGTDQRIKLITIDSITSGLPPKKNALTEGIRGSKGEILCFTDADCLPSSSWIASLVSCFDEAVGVVAGYSPYDASMLPNEIHQNSGRKLLFKFITGEEFKGAIWSSGAIGMNLAWLCTGRNLAYRREVFEQVGGFEKIKMSISGDDDLFIQLVRRQTKWKFRYDTSPESFVRTAPPASFGEFLEQRTRHFSAGKYFTLPMQAFFFFFHASNLILFLGLLTAFYSLHIVEIAIISFAIKLGSDLFLKLVATYRFGRKDIPESFHFSDFLLTEILYIFYNTFIGPLGFIQTIKWKQNKIELSTRTDQQQGS